MSYADKRLVRMTFPEHTFSGSEIFSTRLPYDELGNATSGKVEIGRAHV